ncbi:MAG: hypothetical protein C3F02_01430 [Parcubacteria group bacterium]|nr:MAG: hypothetical protein C3F02_01430 [Parcubacteria group bacterium]
MEEVKTNMPPDKRDVEENKLISALAYISIICLVPLFLKRESKFAQFHAKQGLILFIIELFAFIPFFGTILFIIAVILAILGALNAWNGKYWVMPVLGQFASKLNI